MSYSIAEEEHYALMDARDLINQIKQKIAEYYVNVHKPAESPNLADWTILSIRNTIRTWEEENDNN